MRANMIRISMLAIGLAATPAILAAQDNSIAGVWNVTVTVKNCQTNALITTVHSLQMFLRDGSMIETANTASRGISVGAWTHAEGQTYQGAFSFFRYKPDGTFGGIGKAVETIKVSNDGSQFAASGTIQDYDSKNALTSTACFTHAATRQPDASALSPAQSK